MSVVDRVTRFLHKVSKKWYDIGVELKVDEEVLKDIKNKHDEGQRLRAVVEEWYKKFVPPSLESLKRSLKGALKRVSEESLGEEGIT